MSKFLDQMWDAYDREHPFDSLVSAISRRDPWSYDTILCSNKVWDAILHHTQPHESDELRRSTLHGIKVVIQPERDGWVLAKWDKESCTYKEIK